MDELKKELKRLNDLFERFLEAYLGELPSDVLSSHGAFRATSLQGRLMIRPVKRLDRITLSELWGIDHVLRPAKENLEHFLKGLPAQNVLLYGPRGTGKSSLVKALYNEYKDHGLKIIELTHEALPYLGQLIEALHERTEKFILFCDDLSFQDIDRSFLSLKTLLEGGLEARPMNIIIYATSNRRNLIVETRRDNMPEEQDGELHPSDSLEEKVSLSERFGLRLYTGHFGKDTYLEIVRNYLRLRKMESGPEVEAEALQWATARGGFTGRVARQFVEQMEAKERG